MALPHPDVNAVLRFPAKLGTSHKKAPQNLFKTPFAPSNFPPHRHTATPHVFLRRAGRPCPPKQRLPHPHFVLILSFRASAHTGVGIRIPRPLPLPLGEVAERSEDGEGKQRKAASRQPFFQLVDKPILSFRGAPQGYLLRGAKRRGNPQSFSCKFAEKRKNCAIRGQIATPVCGLARNDGLFRQPVSTRSVDGGIVVSGWTEPSAPTHAYR